MELNGERILLDYCYNNIKKVKQQIETDKSFLKEDVIILAKQIGYVPPILPTRYDFWQWCQIHNLYEISFSILFEDDLLKRALHKYINLKIMY